MIARILAGSGLDDVFQLRVSFSTSSMIGWYSIFPYCRGKIQATGFVSLQK